ncbi:MAG: DUF885 domain-containing protein, partial [Hyphococcus sp.]
MTVQLRNLFFTSAAATALVAACDDSATTPDTSTAPVAATLQETSQDQTQAINAWFEDQFERELMRSPIYQTFLGRKSNYDKWDDVSDAYETESHALLMASLEEMRRTFDYDKLDPAAQLSYRLYEYRAEQADKAFAFRKHSYVFSQFRGWHSQVPAFMINQHRVDSVEDAEAYIARLDTVDGFLGQHQANAEEQFAMGVNPPKWAYPLMIATARNILSGAPFDDSEDPSTLLADLNKKIDAIDASDEAKDDLRARGVAAMLNSVKPAYESLIAMFEEHQETAANDDGAWKLPDGAAYYANRLERMTTTDMTAAEIHDLGLAEVARIHGEMNAIKEA